MFQRVQGLSLPEKPQRENTRWQWCDGIAQSRTASQTETTNLIEVDKRWHWLAHWGSVKGHGLPVGQAAVCTETLKNVHGL